MANNYSPEEIQRIQEEYAYNLEKGIPISKELATEFANAKIGLKNWNQELNKTVKDLGSGVLNTVAALKDGAQGSSVFNQNIKEGSEVLAKFLERIPYVGKALAALAKGAATYAVEANKQSDALYKSYQELSRFGQATASGMDDVFSTMQKFSYGIGELDQMTALLKENAKSLALFGGTVAQGTDRIATTANEFKESGLQEYFMKMGVSVDNQNRAIAGYAKQTANLGQAQAKTQADLTKGASEYLREMEGLTRLTGQTREEMEQQREQAMAVDQFAATVSDMGDQGKELQKVFNMLMSVDPAKARGFAESVSGFMTGSKEQNQLFQSSSGQLFGIVDGIKKGTMGAGEAMNNLFPKGDALKFQKNLASMGIGADYMGSLSGSLKANNKNWEEAAKSADGQTQVTGELTDAAVDLRQSQMKARDALQKMINDGVLPATKAMAALAGVTEKAAEGSKGFWDKLIDGTKKLFGGGGDTSESGDQVSKAAATIRQQESGNNYNAQAKGSSASGAYQFIDSTWQSLTKKYGEGQEYKQAKLAPKEIQDAIAKKYIAEILKESGGDISKVPLKWYTGNIQGKISQDAIDKNNGLTPEAYQKKWMKSYGNQPGDTTTATAPNEKDKQTKASAPDGTTPSNYTAATSSAATPSAVGNKQDSDAMAKLNAQWQKQMPTVPIEGATGFNGMLTGPTSGYKPDITMHGTENLKITPINRPDQTAIPGMDTTIMSQQLSKMDQLVQAFNNTSTQDMMAMQLNKLDELVRVMQNQVNVSTKILQQSR